jgi:hypothetical protein
MFCSVAARGERGGLAVVNANGYNTSNGYNTGSDLFEQMCESVAPTVRQ